MGLDIGLLMRFGQYQRGVKSSPQMLTMGLDIGLLMCRDVVEARRA
jgi:hypothetical protein